MKTYICNRCEHLKSKPCLLIADDDSIPTHCPCIDSMKPYATFIEHQEIIYIVKSRKEILDKMKNTKFPKKINKTPIALYFDEIPSLAIERTTKFKRKVEYEVDDILINSDNIKCVVTKKGAI